MTVEIFFYGDAQMSDTAILTKDEVMEALKDVYDPEIPVNVVDLGLVYDCQVDQGAIGRPVFSVRYRVAINSIVRL